MLHDEARKLGYRVSDRKLAAAPTVLPDRGRCRSRRQVLARSLRGVRCGSRTAPKRSSRASSAGSCWGWLAQQRHRVSAFVTPGEMAHREALEGEVRDIEYASVPVGRLSRASDRDRGAGSGLVRRAQDGLHDPRAGRPAVPARSASRTSRPACRSRMRRCTGIRRDRAGRYAVAEQRRARHILIQKRAATPLHRSGAPAGLLAACRPERDFAKLARENSDDPGSKSEGESWAGAGREACVAPFAVPALFAAAGAGERARRDTIRAAHHPARGSASGDAALSFDEGAQ